MSATEKLRKMLDERGVKHYDGTELTLWLKDEHGYRASADELTSGRLSVHIWCGTPEQAIDATLGTPRLPHWWTHDGTLYIDAPRMPTRIVVNEDGSCEFVPKREMDAENAKLREQIFWLKQGDILHVLTDQEYIDQCERERLMQVSIDALDKENAKLREEIAKWERLAAGIDLPDYPVTQFKPKDLERENAKLLKQVVRCRDCKHYSDHEWVIATDVSDVCHFWADGVKVEPDGFCAWGRLKEEQ